MPEDIFHMEINLYWLCTHMHSQAGLLPHIFNTNTITLLLLLLLLFYYYLFFIHFLLHGDTSQ
jgi:hypothetical protein